MNINLNVLNPKDSKNQNQNKYKKASKISNYEIIKTIGEGTFSKVKLGIHIPTGEKVAIKILEKSKIEDNEDLQCINREISFLKNLSHPNIISIYEIIETNESFYIIMEYAENDLFSYIVQKNFLNETIAKNFYLQILLSIEYIHKKKISHRDIKPENILLTENNTQLKIIDFGLANNYLNNNLLSTSCGSPCYAAPEMVMGKKYNGIEIDIWSSGIVLYAMLCGYLPFEDDCDENIYRNVVLGKFDIPERLSFESKDLIKKILEVNPKKRIKLKDIKEHKFLKGVYNNIQYIYHNDFFKVEDFEKNYKEVFYGIIDKMVDMGIESREEIIFNINNKVFNNITATFKLLSKKALRNIDLFIKGNSKGKNNYNNKEEDCLSSYSLNNKNDKNENNNNINNIENKRIKNNYKINNNNNNNNDVNNKNNNSNNSNNHHNNIIIINNINNIHNSKFNKIDKMNITPIKTFINNEKIIKGNSIKKKGPDKKYKINSYGFQKKININHKNKKKINFVNSQNLKKIKGTLINNYKHLMKNVQKIFSNRGRNEHHHSFSLDRNSNFNKTYGNTIKNKINNILSSSNLKINSIRLSVEPINRKNLFSKQKQNSTNKSAKSKRKKQLSIITSGNTFIDSYDNVILNTDNNNTNNFNNCYKEKIHKRAISGFPSPNTYSTLNTYTYTNNNESIKNSNISTLNNITINNKKNISNYKVKKHSKTINVNNLNIINNKDNVQNNKQKKLAYMRNHKNLRDIMNNNKFLLKTFIEPSISKKKSPINYKEKTNNKNALNTNIKNTTPSSKNYNLINFKEKTKQINLNIQKFTNFTINELQKKGKNVQNFKITNNLRNKLVNSKQDFACFTTKLNLNEIISKLGTISIKTGFILKKQDKNIFHFYNEYNEYVIIEISKIGEKSMINLFHITGNETFTKEVIKNLIVEIGF